MKNQKKTSIMIFHDELCQKQTIDFF